MTLARRQALLASAALLSPAAAPAQTAAPAPQATPTTVPQATPTTVPGLENYSLPGTPAPVPTPAPTTTPTPAPAATPEPAPTRPAALRRAPRSEPSGTPAPGPAATATPVPEVVPPPPAEPPAPPPAAAPETPRPAQAPGGGGLGRVAALGGAAAGALILSYALRRRRRADDAPDTSVEFVPPPAPEPAPPVARARLALELRPMRAGLNLLSATVECEVVVANTGDAPAQGVRLGVRLLSAHAGQDAELAALFAQPVARPVAAPFALAPGQARAVRAVAALPIADIRGLEANGRPIFVPLVAASALYRAADGLDGRVAQAWAVGVERADGPKLAPFRLDRPARTVEGVAARPVGAPLEAVEPRAGGQPRAG